MSRMRLRFGALLLLSLAVAAAVGFVSGAFGLAGAIRAAVYDETARRAAHVAAHATGALTDADVAAIRALPGVDVVQPRGLGAAGLARPDGTGIRLPGRPQLLAFAAAGDARVTEHDLAAGALPRRPGEALVHRDVADRAGWQPGAPISVLDGRGRGHPFVVAGIVTGDPDQGVVGLLPADHRRIVGAEAGWTAIDVVAPGVAAAEVQQRVAGLLGARATVISGAAWAEQLAAERLGGGLTGLLLGLRLFAWLAVAVAVVVSHNTFTVVVAQRQRELALLRCVGAGRRQVFAAVVAESLFVGALAAALGYLAGIGLTAGGWAALRALDVPVPGSGGVSPTLGAALTAGLVGVGVTVLSAVLPAWAATKVAPVRALAAQAELVEDRRVGRLRVGGGLLLLALGLGGAGLSAARQDPSLGLGAGCVVMLALLALGPVVVGPAMRAVGWPARFAGPVGRLARTGGARNPRRAAAATNALTLGIGLVSVLLVGAASMQVTGAATVAGNHPVDYVVTDWSGGALPAGLAQRLAGAPALADAVPVARGEARRLSVAGGEPASIPVSGVDPGAVRRRLPADTVRAGALADLRPGTVVLTTGAADMIGKPEPGAEITIDGGRSTAVLRVAAVVDGGFESPFGAVLVTPADLARLFGSVPTSRVLLWAAPGTPAATSRQAVDDAVGAFPDLAVADSAAARAEITGTIDRLLLGGGLLTGMAIVVALIGIAVTLTLSVLERLGEFAVLRALGFTRTQLYGTLAMEGVIMSMTAAVLGAVLGVLLGIAGTLTLLGGYNDLHVVVPVGRIGVLILAAALAGLLAALLPARLAARAAPAAALAG